MVFDRCLILGFTRSGRHLMLPLKIEGKTPFLANRTGSSGCSAGLLEAR